MPVLILPVLMPMLSLAIKLHILEVKLILIFQWNMTLYKRKLTSLRVCEEMQIMINHILALISVRYNNYSLKSMI